MKKLTLFFIVFLSINLISAQEKYPDNKIAIINAKIVDIDKEQITAGNLLIDEGKIEALFVDPLLYKYGR